MLTHGRLARLLFVLAPQTEWLQAYIPGRGASLADVLADLLGLAVGVAWAWAWVLRRRKCCAVAGASVAAAAVAPTATSG